MTRIISISGAYRAGKTTLGQRLALNFSNSIQTAFADDLKEYASQAYPSKRTAIYADDKSAETRELLNEVGLFYKSIFGRDYFIELLHQKISDYDYAFITDTRFDNEFSYLANQDTKYIYIGEMCDQYHMRHNLERLTYLTVPYRTSYLNPIIDYVAK